MNKFSLLLLSFILVYSIPIYAQKKAGYTNYKVLVDDPDHLHPLFLSFDILTADTWNTSSYMGYGLRAEANVLRYGSISFDYRKGYLGEKQKVTELGGSLNLFCSRKKSIARVVLSSSAIAYGNKLVIKGTSINVPAIKKTVLQARGGIAAFNAGIDEAPDGNGKSASEDPRKFYIKKDTNNIIIGFGKGYKGVYGFTGFMKMQVYYAGLSMRTIRNLVIAHDEGLASNSDSYNFYVDALAGGDLSFTDITYSYRPSALSLYEFPTGTKPEEYELVAKSTKKMGWRAGWEAKTNAGASISYKVEFGSRPGYKSGKGLLASNNYLVLAAGISISGGKPYRKMAKETK